MEKLALTLEGRSPPGHYRQSEVAFLRLRHHMEGLDRQSLAEGRRWTRIAFGVPETGLREDGPQRGPNCDQSHEKILSEAGDGQP
jgi:hypothetical protein